MVKLFNTVEVFLWAAIGLYFFARSYSQQCRASLIAAVTFLAFAGSDAVEIQTGAWWRPWWLFVWKAACVVILTLLAVHQHRLASKSENVAD